MLHAEACHFESGRLFREEHAIGDGTAGGKHLVDGVLRNRRAAVRPTSRMADEAIRKLMAGRSAGVRLFHSG